MVRLGRPISTIPPNQGGARHFAGEFYALQGIMTGDGKLTTSHPVTECRNGPAQSLADRDLQGFWLKFKKLHIGTVNAVLLPLNSGSRPRLMALVGRLYRLWVQSANMRQILISVGLLIY